MNGSRWRAALANAVLAVASIALCSLVVEGLARLLVSRAGATSGSEAMPISRYHSVLGWDKPPGAHQWIRRPEFEIELRFNSHGLRGPERDYAKPPGTRRVLILGDSFAEGYYAPEEETARAVLESLLRDGRCRPAEVINGGTIAYSTDQEYLFYGIEGRRYAPDLVLLFFYSNDLYYNASAVGPGNEAKPFFVVEDSRLTLHNSPVPRAASGQLSRVQPGPRRLKPWRGSIALRLLSNRTVDASPVLHRFLAAAGLVEPVAADPPKEFWPYGPHREEVEEMWRRTEAILGALAKEVERDGARLAVLYIPARFEVNDAVWALTQERHHLGRRWDRPVVFDRLAAILQSLGVPLVDPRASLRRAENGGPPAYYTRDVHWTAVGNALAAHALEPAVESALDCASVDR